MKPTETLAREKTPEGDEMVLYRRDGAYYLSIDGEELMSSRAYGSERVMAHLALAALDEKKSPRVLVGGMGFGYTLRAALDSLPPGGRVVICELFASLLEWNRGVLADLAGRPLEDRRVSVVQADVQTLFGGHEKFDAILLDVDNGPEAFTLRSNQGIYTSEGLARIWRSLNEGGVLAVWSSIPDAAFERRLRRAGYEAWTERVPSRIGGKGKRHSLFMARRRTRKASS